MPSTKRQHVGTALVAVAVVLAAFAEGLFEPTGYAAGSIVIWAAVIAGLVGRVLPTGPVSPLAAAAGLCLAGTAILSTASVAWAADQGRAFEEAVRVDFYLGLFALAACTADPESRSRWLAGMCVGLGAISIVALFAYLQPGTLGSGTSDVPGAAGRLSYPVGYWNAAGALLAAATTLLANYGARAPSLSLRVASIATIPPAALALWLTSSRGGAAALLIAWAILVAASSERARQLLAVAIGGAGAAVLIAASGQLDALSSGVVDSARRADGDRMSAICVAVIAVTAIVAWRLDGWRPRVRLTRPVVAALAALAVAGGVAGMIALDPAAKLDEFEQAPPTKAGVPVGAAGFSSNGRWQFWGEALDAFDSAPVGGLGAGGFESWWAQRADVPLFVRNPHSLPLQQAAELGLPGIGLFLGFVGVLIVAARRRLGAGLQGDAGVLIAIAAAGAAGAAVDWTWEIPAAFGPAVVCAALLTASAPVRRSTWDGYWLGLGTVVAAWLAIVAGGLVVLSDLELKRSREAAGAGNFSEAMDRARAAHTIQPWSAGPYTQLALLDQEQNDVPAALENIRLAQDRDSEDWRLPLIEASLQQQRGDVGAAQAAYRRAEQLSPLPLRSVVFAPQNQG
jgi:hypothetical protein